MPLRTLSANMCPLYLIVQWQQIYVAKLQKVNPPQIPPQAADIDQGNMEFSCPHWTIIISRLELPVFVFGHFPHSILTLPYFAFVVFYLEFIVTSPPITESSADLSSPFAAHPAHLSLSPAWPSSKPTWFPWTEDHLPSLGKGRTWDKKIFCSPRCTIISRIIW